MEYLIQHYLKRLDDKNLTRPQRKTYEYLLDEYALLFIKELNDDCL